MMLEEETPDMEHQDSLTPPTTIHERPPLTEQVPLTPPVEEPAPMEQALANQDSTSTPANDTANTPIDNHDPTSTNLLLQQQQQQQQESSHTVSSRRRFFRESHVPPHASSSNRRIGKIYHKNSKQEIKPIHSARPIVDTEGNVLQDEDAMVTWGDVGRACCCHSLGEWLHIAMGISMLLACLYFFLLGLDLLGTSFEVVGGCTAGSMLGSETNPMAGVMIGIVATALLQSSSTTTSIVVSLVDGGLDVQQGIYIVMGANVGTSITSMLVSLAHIGDGDELEKAFAASSVNWVFKFFTVIILLILEVTTKYLYRLTKAMLPSAVGDGDNWEGPIKQIVSPLSDTIIIANKILIDNVATGTATCSGAYPVVCDDGKVSASSCTPGLIGCNLDNGRCPAFFQEGASKNDDIISGWVCLFVALTLLIFCLLGLVALLRKMLFSASTRIILKATDINEYVAMAIGCGVTILVQSSSITTSTLIPLAGIGVLKLEKIYPLTLGADIGTTFTALMAAMVSSSVESLQIALAHLFFALTGIVIWYPIPFMRSVPIRIARGLGQITSFWRSFPILFIAVMYFLVPLLLLGISSCFEKQTKGFTGLGVLLLLIICGSSLWFWTWWRFQDGKEKFKACIRHRQRHSAALKTLADDIDYLKCDMEYSKNEIGRLKDFAGIVRMEDGRPVEIVTEQEAREAEKQWIDGESVAMLDSYQSMPWQGVLLSATRSVRSSLHGGGSTSHAPRSLQQNE